MEHSCKKERKKECLRSAQLKSRRHSPCLEGCVFLVNQMQLVQVIFEYLRLTLIASISGKLI